MAGNVLDAAHTLATMGFNPLPTRRGRKTPGLPSWQEYQQKRTDDKVAAWWGPGSSYTGIWVVCGAVSNLIVLDCDIPEADESWHELIGAEMEATTCVRTNKGRHYWFTLGVTSEHAVRHPPAQGGPDNAQRTPVGQSWVYKDNHGRHWFDVKGEGGGVMAPPSEHPDGGYYEWIRGPEQIIKAPEAILDGGVLWGQRLQILSGDGSVGATDGPGAGPGSTLAGLLQNPPEVGSRNSWLTQVAGHYAKIIPFNDAYIESVAAANNLLSNPLGSEEVAKTSQSIWKAEKTRGLTPVEELREQHFQAQVPDETNGWLMGTGNRITCPAIVKLEVGGKLRTKEVMDNWSDFDIRVLGVVEHPDGEKRDYLIKLTTQHRTIECLLPGSTLGVWREMGKWLAERQGSVVPPIGDIYAKIGRAERLQRYVQNQPAPRYQTVDALGWDDNAGAFVTHEGLIRVGGARIEPFEAVRPNPQLVNWAPYRYGFAGSKEAAQDVLREVITYHDRMVCAIFGSWWAATFLKAHIEKETALFPFMALRAASESGKTTGFFSLMMQLAGNAEGHGEYTPAVLRDRVSSHKNGIVWIDDVTDLESTWDTVRQATMGGGRTKKSGDRKTQEYVKLVAPIVISAEGMEALSTEKALSDRAIIITVPSPTGRTSLKSGREGRPQWDDILDLQSQWRHDFTQLAGWYVAMALEMRPKLEEMRTLRSSSGRHGDKLAILRVGARILAEMSDTDWMIAEVDDWCEREAAAYFKGDNILTTEMLPWGWAVNDFIRSPALNCPVYVDRDGIVWFHAAMLARQWNERRGLTPRQRQLGEPDSVHSQLRDLGVGKAVNKRVGDRSDNVVMKFYCLNERMSQLVISRAQAELNSDRLL